MKFPKPTARERFFRYVRQDADTGCWIWLAGMMKGYGSFNDHNKYNKLAHRWAFAELRGEQLLNGLELDHLCRNPSCVNPWHLEQVDHRTNMLRSLTGASAVNARKVTCIKGHALTPDNLAPAAGSHDRICKICREEYNRNYHRKRYDNDADFRARCINRSAVARARKAGE